MKNTIETLQEFFKDHGITVESFDLKVSRKGQVERCIARFKTGEALNPPTIVKTFRKKIVSRDYRFNNTELEIAPAGFPDVIIITSK